MRKSFYIIDGHAQIFRAYFAPFRELTSPSGEPTKATFVFAQMLLSLIEQRKPDYIAMAIDSGDETVFRKQIFPEYKANRVKPPDDFPVQEQRILQLVRDAGIPIFAKGGFEADDLIATMARRLCGEEFDIFIVSKDKDLRQIVNDCTRMYDVQSNEIIDAAVMEAKCGFGPAEAIEVQTLMGDSTDNVPGIPGIGEKTAAKLIKKYGKADAILEHLEELTPKMRENFQQYAGRLPTARQLVTLKDDVDFPFDPEACRFGGLNMTALRADFERLGFYGLLKRLGDRGAGFQPASQGPGQQVEDSRLKTRSTAEATRVTPRPADVEQGLFGAMEEPREARPSGDGQPARAPASTAADCEYHLIDTEAKLAAFIKDLRKQKRFAFDTETDALGAMRSNVVGMSFSWKPGTGYYLPVAGPAQCVHVSKEQVLDAVRPILEDESIKKVGHNIKYDLLVMRKAGVEVRGIEMDSMIAAFLVDSSRYAYGIDRLAMDLFNFRKIATEELIGSGKKQTTMDCVALDRVAVYASEDADIALRLADLMRQKLHDLPAIEKLNDDLETPLIDVLAEMEFNGVAIDPGMLQEQSKVLGGRIDELRRRIIECAGGDFNPDSTKQLADVLFNRLRLRVIKRNKTGPSTDVEVLEKLALEHECPRLMLEYRSLVKLKNTYLDTLRDDINPRTKRIHASFSQIGAETGRLSCSDPNLQNIPIRTDEGQRIRLAFVPGDAEHNVLMTADYSQIELRILAHFTEEPALMRAFEADEDVHAAVAAEVFNVPLDKVDRSQRNQAKIINFGIIYGVSAFGLARRIDGLSVKAAEELIAAYNKRFPSIATFLNKCVMEAKSQGYVETIMGRRRAMPDINSAVLAQRNAAERMAINSVVQGSAADLIKVAMLNVYRRMLRENRPSKLLLQVHDELVFETPQTAVEADSAIIREEMVNAMKLKVPLKVDIGWGKNWQEGK